jgi:hypothetical protein
LPTSAATEEKPMPQPRPYPDDDDRDQGPERDEGTPRWKSVLGIFLAAIVIIVVAFLHLAGIVGPGTH